MDSIQRSPPHSDTLNIQATCMRRARLLLLLVIGVILAAVGLTYRIHLLEQRRGSPSAPPRLADGITSKASKYRYTQTDGQRKIVDVLADDMQQVSEPSHFRLTGVELHIYHKDQQAYDKVESAQASFDLAEGVLYADGEVKITMGVSAAAPDRSGRLVSITTSGVRFENKTGKAHTDRPASFVFDRGEGRSSGADYDPTLRELSMLKDVQLKWHGNRPGAQAMVVTSGNLIYKELESKVYLSPWAKLVRGSLTLETSDAIVTIVDDVIREVHGQVAHGTRVDPGRKLDYAAEQLHMVFAANGNMEKIEGTRHATLLSTAPSGRTAVSADRVDVFFNPATKESVLLNVHAQGKSVIDSQPVLIAGKPAPDTRILKSEMVLLTMRTGGETIEKVETESPGTLEFVPNRPDGRRRFMTGERMWMNYGERNQADTFRAVSVTTRTEPQRGQKGAAPLLTRSRDLLARFDAVTGEMNSLEQWNEFQYEEGQRRATAEKAKLESGKNQITLDGQARVWDPSGSTSADKILLDQATSDFSAIGKVDSTRMPESKKGNAQGSLVSGDAPVQGRADRMMARNRQTQIRYEGNAVLWQGSNRIHADRIDIDREKRRLEADKNVVSRFLEDDEEKKKAPVVTVVKAPHMVYTDEDRLAHYTGGVRLTRPSLEVQSKELRAWLKEESKQTTLDRAIADGSVKIVQSAPDRTRTGTGEHAEYEIAENKVVMNGGAPQLVDSRRGTTRGQQLTWFADDDRLLVNGAEAQPAVSNLKRK